MASAKHQKKAVNTAESTDECLDGIEQWYSKIDNANQADLQLMGRKLGLGTTSTSPSKGEIKNAMLNRILDAAHNKDHKTTPSPLPQPQNSASPKSNIPMCQNASGEACMRKSSWSPAPVKNDIQPVLNVTILDFRLSHGDEQSSALFENQLVDLLLRAQNMRMKVYAPTLNKTVSKQMSKMIPALKAGQQICSVDDVEKFFTQDYIINMFLANEDEIVWDGETTEQNAQQQDWTFRPSKRATWVRKRIFSMNVPDSLINITTYELLPPVFARVSTSGWQSTRFTAAGSPLTNANARFPDWIRGHTFVGEHGRVINLHRYLHSGKVFGPQCHLGARNIIYYLVIYNEDYERHHSVSSIEIVPSVVQVYAGKAANGVERRWVVDRWAHCKAILSALQGVQTCTDILKYMSHAKEYQLVDCYLALAHLCQFPMALFVVEECGTSAEMEAAEADLICSHNLTNMQHGLNCKQEKRKVLPADKTAPPPPGVKLAAAVHPVAVVHPGSYIVKKQLPKPVPCRPKALRAAEQ